VSARHALARFRAPDEAAAQERAWAVVRAAALDAAPSRRPARRWRVAIAPALVAVLAAAALTPAGATVRHWISHALGLPHPAPALFSLPSPGRLLVTGPAGTWTVAADGTARRLGSWPQASWSPRGRFVVVARADELAAVDPHGVVRWAVARPAVAGVRWYGPNGYRVAYRSGRTLRVIAGDGTGDHLLAFAVAPVAPAWRPGSSYEVAYLTAAGHLVVREADTGVTAWTAASGVRRPIALAWSRDGTRLMVVGRGGVAIYDAAGRRLMRLAVPSRTPLLDGALAPDGRTFALVRGGADGAVLLGDVAARGARLDSVLTGRGLRQVTFSPDNRWLLATWPAADQWVFVRVGGRPALIAASHIAHEFGAGARVDGWCC
jgi:hypothetical protein